MRRKILIALVGMLPLSGFAQSKNWQNMDLQQDGVFGISTEKAYMELLKGKTPQPVIVAVIDGGIDTNHEDLKAVLWHNPTPKAFDNGTYGWSFLGPEVYIDNNEETVVVRELRQRDTTRLSGRDLANYHAAKQRLQEQLPEARRMVQLMEKTIDSLFAVRTREVKEFVQRDTTRLSAGSLVTYHAKKEDLRRLTEARSWKQLGEKSLDSLLAARYVKGTQTPSQIRFVCSAYFKALANLACQLNTAYDPMAVDGYLNTKQHRYGCPDVMGPDPSHGTFVAGIIGAVRNNGIGINGVADDVRIMTLRVVPVLGQIRTRNMASAIRYAAGHGAKVINMSLGSSEFAEDRKEMEAAVKYAMKKDVLIVQASGNLGKNMDTGGFFMNRDYPDGGHAGAYIMVGYSGWKNDSTLCGKYSDYGKTSVDVFAPGDQITSAITRNKYAPETGTSMAAPVVSGLAALIREYYPKLTAQQVKDIILQSVVKSDYLNGKCVSGGVVNAYNALQLAAKQADLNSL